MKVSSSGRAVYNGCKEGSVIFVELHGVAFNIDRNALVKGKVDNREKVVSKVWDIENIRKLHLRENLVMVCGLEDDCASTLRVDGGSISHPNFNVAGSEVPNPVMMWGHMTCGSSVCIPI